MSGEMPAQARDQVCSRIQFLAKALTDIFPTLSEKLQITVTADMIPWILVSTDRDFALEKSVWQLLQLLCADALPIEILRTPVCLFAEASVLDKIGAGGPAPLTMSHLMYRVHLEWNTFLKNGYVLFWILKDYVIPQSSPNCFCWEWVSIVQKLVGMYISGRRDFSTSLAELIPGASAADIEFKKTYFCAMPSVPSFELMATHERFNTRSFLRIHLHMLGDKTKFSTLVPLVLNSSQRAVTIVSHICQGQRTILLHEFHPSKKSGGKKKKSKGKAVKEESDVFRYLSMQPFEFVPMKIAKHSCSAEQLAFQLTSPSIQLWRKFSLMTSLDMQSPSICAGLRVIQYEVLRPIIQAVKGRPLEVVPDGVGRLFWIALCVTFFHSNMLEIDNTRSLMFQLAREIPETHWLASTLKKKLRFAETKFVAMVATNGEKREKLI